MRLHFQKSPGDLYLAVGYTAGMTGVLLALDVADLLAILLVLLVPGYVLVAALSPGFAANGKPGLDWIERITLSLGLSIAVASLLGLFLSFSSLGTRVAPVAVAITLFTMGTGAIAYLRRMRLPLERRLSLTLNLALPAWQGSSLISRALTISLAVSIVVGSGTLLYLVLPPRPGEAFTEFYMLGPGGNASGYPTALNISQTATVFVGISNHESSSINYTLRIDLVGVRLVYNVTSGLNETIEVNRSTWSTINVSLADSANWIHDYTFSIRSAGLWEVRFLLFKNGDLSLTYRKLYLLIRVT